MEYSVYITNTMNEKSLCCLDLNVCKKMRSGKRKLHFQFNVVEYKEVPGGYLRGPAHEKTDTHTACLAILQPALFSFGLAL